MRHPAVDAFLAGLSPIEWASDVWLYGSLATGDHQPGASDIDLLALTTRSLGVDDLRLVRRLHQRIDTSVGTGSALGCALRRHHTPG